MAVRMKTDFATLQVKRRPHRWSTTRTLALATRLTRQTIRVNVVFQPNPVPGLTTLHPTLRDHWTNFDGDLTETLQDPLTIGRRGPLSLWKRNLLSIF